MSLNDPEQNKAYHREYHREWYRANKENKKKRDRENYQNNREAYLATNRKWERENWIKRLADKKRYRDTSPVYRAYLERTRGKRNERSKAWAKKNRDKMNSVKQRRRAKESGCLGNHTTAEWNELLKRYEHTCLKCGKREPTVKLERDHIIPIIVGGSNNISNIQPLCGACNKSKSDHAVDYRPKFLRSARRRAERPRTNLDLPMNLELFFPSPPREPH